MFRPARFTRLVSLRVIGYVVLRGIHYGDEMLLLDTFSRLRYLVTWFQSQKKTHGPYASKFSSWRRQDLLRPFSDALFPNFGFLFFFLIHTFTHKLERTCTHTTNVYTHTQTNFVALIARSFRFLIYSTTHFIVYVPRGRSLRVLLLKFGCFCCHSTLEHQGTGRTLFSFLGLSSLCSSGAPPLPKSAHHHLLSITSTGRVVWWCACCCYSVTQGFFLSLRGAGSGRRKVTHVP